MPGRASRPSPWGEPVLAPEGDLGRAAARAARPSLRLLDRRDLDAALDLCARDLVTNLFVASRLQAHGVTSRHTGWELWGWFDGGELVSMCWSGANLVPVEATPEATEAFAGHARRAGRRCSSLVGPAPTVLDLWSRLEPTWGPAREVRTRQPLMALDGAPAVAPDPSVRRGRMDELEMLVPACVAMFTEEVGYSPVAADGGAVYRGQVTSLVASGRSFVRVDAGPGGRQVVFKAELGSVTRDAVQVQGVWVRPERRGEGLAAPGMAAVAGIVRAEIAPVVSLYVNDYNERAIRAYRRVGFREVGTYATVLF
jgi:predicted GNAT family acetyltransferase